MKNIVVKFNDGQQRVLKCDDAGMFFVDNIPYGKKNFIISSIDQTTPYTTVAYTAVVDTIRKQQTTPSQATGQVTDKNTIIDTLVQDQSANIKLYPLTGAVKGSVYGLVTNNNDAGSAGDSLVVPLANVRIVASFKDTENGLAGAGRITSFPNRFDGKTNALGNFVITGLPIAPGGDIALVLSSIEVIGEDFEGDATQLLNVYASKDTTQLKRAILRSQSSMNNNRDLVYVASSSILGSNKLPLDAINKKDPITFTFTSALKGLPTVTIPNNDFTTALSGDGLTVTLTPKTAGWVVDGQGQQSIFISATLANNTPIRFLTKLKTAQIADGKDYIASSSILSGNNGAILPNLSATSPITFTFTQPLALVPSISFGNNDFATTLSADGLTVTITPKTARWVSGSLTINAELVSGKDINAITFNTVAFAEEITNGLKYVISSSVVNSDGVKVLNVSNTAPITFTLTKKLASVPQVSSSVANQGMIAALSADSLTVTVTKTAKLWTTGEAVTIQGLFADGSKFNLANFVPSFEDAFALAQTLPLTGALAVDGNLKLVFNEPIAKQQVRLLEAGVPVSAAITVTGDSLIADPTYNLKYGTSYTVSGNVENSDGEIIAISSSVTTAASALFVKSNSLLDANGQPRTDVNPYAPIVLVFNKPMHTDITKYTWAAPAGASLGANGASITINGGVDVVGGVAPNATVKVSGDTVTITPDNRMRFQYNAEYGFTLTAVAIDGETSSAVAYKAATGVASDYLIYDNTIDAVTGQDKEFGRLEPVTLAVPTFLALKELTTATVNGSPVSLSAIKLSATGDTATYTPELPSSGLQSLVISGKLKSASGTNTNSIEIVSWPAVEWQIVTAAVSTGSNNIANGAYRPLAATGDSLVVSFDKAIDATKPITVTWPGVTTRSAVSSDGKSVTVYPLDTLGLMAFGTKYNDVNTAAKYTVTFTATTVDGNTANSGSIKVFTQEELVLLDASFRRVHDLTSPMLSSTGNNNTASAYPYSSTTPITLTFNRAVDAASLATGIKYEMFNKKSGVYDSVAVNATLDATKKIVTLTPVTALIAGTKFQISFVGQSVWAENVKNASGTTVFASTLNSVSTEVAVLTNISALKPTMSRVANQKLDWNSSSPLTFNYTELAWDANHDNSISNYQVEAVTSSTSGTPNSKVNVIADANYTIFGTANQTGIGSGNISSLNRVNSMSGYGNTSNLFATGDSINLRMRPMLAAVVGYDANGTIAISDTVYGTWSDAVKFKDELGATDSTKLGAIIGNGVTIKASNALEDANGNSIAAYYNSNGTVSNPFVGRSLATPNTLGVLADTMRVQIEFKEDMDISVKPDALTLLKGTDGQTTNAAFTPSVVPGGTWISARIYEMKIAFPAIPEATWNAGGAFDQDLSGDDLPSTVSQGWGYIVTADAFKDLSGNLSSSWGGVGSASIGSDYTAPAGVLGNMQISAPNNQ